MKDFDALREQRLREREARFSEQGKDRSFLLGGEVFEYRLIFPFEAADAIFSVTGDTGLNMLSDRIKVALPTIIEPGEGGEALRRLQKVMKSEMIELADLRDVVFWIMEEHAERPTPAPTSSGDGRESESTGQSSTDTSSSVQAEPAASVS